jgi:hypothetical protein
MNSAQARARHGAYQVTSNTFDVITEQSSIEASMIVNEYLVVLPNQKNFSEWEIVASNHKMCQTKRDALEVLLKDLQRCSCRDRMSSQVGIIR